MAIAVRSASSASGQMPTTVPAPSGISDGDFLVAAMASKTGSVALPDGWVPVGGAGSSPYIGFATKIASSEPASYQFGVYGQVSVTLTALTGVDIQNPIDAGPSFNADGYNSSAVAPSLNIQTASALLLCEWGNYYGGAITAPSDMTTLGSQPGVLLAAEEIVSSTGATGTRTATLGSDHVSAGSLAIKPDASATSPPSYTGTGTALTATASLATGQGVATQPEVHSGTGTGLSATASAGSGAGSKTASGTGTKLTATAHVGTGAGAKASSGTGAGLTAAAALGPGVGSKAATGSGTPLSGTATFGTGMGTKATGGDGASLLATALLGAGKGSATQQETHTGTGMPLAATTGLGTGTGYTQALRDITLDARLTLGWHAADATLGWGVNAPVGNPASAEQPLVNPIAALVPERSPVTAGPVARGDWSTAAPERSAWSAGEPYIQED